MRRFIPYDFDNRVRVYFAVMKFWDTTEQEPLVGQITDYISSGTALDVGAGYGRDAFFLANSGFEVTATEIDTASIEALKTKNKEAKYTIKVTSANLLSFEPEEPYDVVICDMVLHFLTPNGVQEGIRRLQQWTKPGGYTVITAYSDKNAHGKRPYLFAHNELLEAYKGWNIITYHEVPTPWFQLEGEDKPRRNEAVYLFARKIT